MGKNKVLIEESSVLFLLMTHPEFYFLYSCINLLIKVPSFISYNCKCSVRQLYKFVLLCPNRYYLCQLISYNSRGSQSSEEYLFIVRYSAEFLRFYKTFLSFKVNGYITVYFQSISNITSSPSSITQSCFPLCFDDKT